MDKEAFRKLLVQWASKDVYIGQLTWEEGDALAEYLAKWYAAQQSVQPTDGDGSQNSSVYSHASCMFNYCPTPEACRKSEGGCKHPVSG